MCRAVYLQLVDDVSHSGGGTPTQRQGRFTRVYLKNLTHLFQMSCRGEKWQWVGTVAAGRHVHLLWRGD